MKKGTIIIIASVLVILALVAGLAGCKTGTGATTAPTVTLTGVDSRVSDLETWKTQVVEMWPGMATNSYVDSKVAQMSTPDLSAYATKAELGAYATDAELTTALNNFIASLTPEQIDALKEKLGLTGGGGGTTPVTTGQVTAVFDPTTPAIVSGSGLPIQQFSVIITNGTVDWQYVSYSIIMTCKITPPLTGATVADLDGTNSGTPMSLNTVYGSSLSFTPSFVVNGSGNVTQITFYPDHGMASAPGSSSPSILNYLDFALPGGVAIQEWNCTIIPVYSTANW